MLYSLSLCTCRTARWLSRCGLIELRKYVFRRRSDEKLHSTKKLRGTNTLLVPQPKSWGDLSPPVPVVVAPMPSICGRPGSTLTFDGTSSDSDVIQHFDAVKKFRQQKKKVKLIVEFGILSNGGSKLWTDYAVWKSNPNSNPYKHCICTQVTGLPIRRSQQWLQISL